MNQSQKIYDLIILGGGCAGLTAGIYAGRAKLRTLIIENHQAGGQAATTDEIANYPGFKTVTGPKLMESMLDQAKSFGAEFMTSQVIKADLGSEVKEVKTESGTFRSWAVILATGANPRKLGFEGEEEFRGRGVGYCATCDGMFFEGKDIFVIGGGYSAAEEALYLTRFGRKVTVLVRKDKFRCAKSIADKVLAHPKIEVRFHTELMRVYGNELLEGAVFKNNQTGEQSEYKVSEEDGTFGVFVFIGYQPDAELFRDQIELDPEGYILTDETMQTSEAGVFAAGDVRPKLLRQLVTATADGAVAATQAEKYVLHIKEEKGIEETYPQEEPPIEEKKSAETGAHTDHTGQRDGLEPEVRAQVMAVFEKLNKDITIVTIKDEKNEKSAELANFLDPICSLSPHLHLQVLRPGEDSEMEKKIRFDRLPTAAFLDSSGAYSGIKFCGIPGGHEFNSFILAIYNLAGPGQEMSAELAERARNIQADTRIRIYVSLSCHFCPEVVAAAQHLAATSRKIEAEMIDIGLFPELKKELNLMSVPAMTVNGQKPVFGSKTKEQIMDLIEKASGEDEKQ
ncbi:thioredoxin-disulfide reductase [Anaerovorax odorimutans]|uniref:Thioredoxin-disulfide reductase n=1 Tax=Anaerovorax odorimutans TaxID=109327 RepID=A0ABT1RP27_9FIRM|nr:thioredoxin-disulfide reductase [Anaerovorax odorimutans]MCQ4636949.1 thioredoxin-disulfide reductase [Anaerovorax odorimutans]